jgi:redox-sensitive bicupin YhaK (pirin superfamily)
MMSKIIHRADTRGIADHGWLKAKHSFSFAGYMNPERVHFGKLRVLNDDMIAPAKGFGLHPHDNMEIITIPLSGVIAHKDNTGGNGRITAGEVQVMSAGTGLYHSEFNGSDEEWLSLLQIWVMPKEHNIAPRYDQRTFGLEGRKNQWQIVASPMEADQALWINQDSKFLLSNLEAGNKLNYTPMLSDNGLYIFVIDGELEVEGEVLQKRDALGVTGGHEVTFISKAGAEFLVIDVPMH